jgi:hypothetical protein
LREEGFGPWPKLTGGKGLHLMIPSDRDWSWKAAHEWAKRFATRYAARDDRYTTSASFGRADCSSIICASAGERRQLAPGRHAPAPATPSRCR